MKRMRKSAILAAVLSIAASQGAIAGGGRDVEIFDGLCNRCHGPKGQGMKGLEAPLIAGMPAWYVESQLKKFREGVRGRHPSDDPGMRMRPMARTLAESDLKAISAYVEALPKQPSPQTLADADVEKGKASFAFCAGCHGMDAQGMQAIGAPALAGQNDWYLFTQLKNFKNDVRIGPMMQPVSKGLDEPTMRNVSAYLGTLSGQ